MPVVPSLLSSASLNNSPNGIPMRIIASLIAAVLIAVGIWFSGQPSQASPPKLGDVLSRLEAADDLQLQVTRDGATANVWVKQPGLVRWEDSPSQYRIARGSRLWRVNETNANDSLANAPKDVPTNVSLENEESEDNPWFGDDGRVDLLSLLNVDANSDRQALRNALPAGTATYAGKVCHRYQQYLTGEHGEYRLEVYVDQKTEQLAGIIARDPQAPVGQPPVAELTLIAMNAPVDEDKFRVPVKLADSNRIGKVTDTQGIVTLRPVGAKRWTPVCRQLLVQPGDWIRTDIRGANAATVELTSKVTLIVGPATLIELVTPNEARLHAGSVQVATSKLTTGDFKLTGTQNDDTLTFNKPGKQLIKQSRDEKLTAVKGKPVWLAGYEGTSAEDSIGSLIVNVDGREQSLTVGEHHVTVEIRDQIARTTIEETFVNHTNSRLEGQFHFPLPQDASISGFGMWINGELIEADIVEKQRAREIYETILREKRDPGLLEWTGGNIFKARVFPIEAHSEKRIKIVYTQVLPLQGNRFRYSYALKSEMLQTNPLRELNIRVLLSSAVPLSEVTSTTHTCRTQQTKHSAQLEFVAQEYTPTRDFEVVCEVDHRENDILVIPHRRGDDGYFLMQLMPPGAEGNWTREVIPDGDPLDIILLCDTSGSMDSGMRKTQAAFVSTLLTSLGEQDRFTLATTDVETHWAFDKFVTADEDNITKVRDFLDARISLGWTDLDQAFAAVLKKAKPGTQIIYVGDGIVTTVESDPSAFVGRLKLLNTETGPNAKKDPATFHAVSVGSSYESVVLKGIASLGGGSVRQISGETTPQETAMELLNEIAQPGLKNINVEFRGVRVAAVYPEQLPNIAAGTQQILVGRYLPQGEQQSGEVIVTGELNGQPVKYVGKIALANAEKGNSFIPRLWARGRLDSLLQEGSTQLIQDEIIGLSEEFHIITPYTSLLVLESDADRERFGVKRRFEMRDGERFFADGRDNANYELRQQQMQRAGNWRLDLRRQLLAQLANYGRDPKAFQGTQQVSLARMKEKLASKDFRRSQRESYTMLSSTLEVTNGLRRQIALEDGRELGLPQMVWDRNGTDEKLLEEIDKESSFFVNGAGFGGGLGGGGQYGLGTGGFAGRTQTVSGAAPREEAEVQFKSFNNPLGETRSTPSSHAAWPDGVRMDHLISDLTAAVGAGQSSGDLSLIINQTQSIHGPLYGVDGDDFGVYNSDSTANGLMLFRGGGEKLSLSLFERGGQFQNSYGYNNGRGYDIRPDPWQSVRWVDVYFPVLAAAPDTATPKKPPVVKSDWPAPAVKLAESLLREKTLRQIAGGLEIERVTESYNDSYDRLTPANRRLELWSPDRWLTRDFGQGQHPLVNWLDGQTRGIYREAFLLGRSRKSVESEFDTLPLALPDHSLSSLHETYREHYRVIVEQPAKNRAILRCIYKHNETSEVRFTIDTARNVLLQQQTLEAGKVNSTTTHSDFVEVAGLWWATKIETVVAAHPDRVTRRVTQTVQAYDDENFTENWQAHKSLAAHTIFLTEALPSVKLAKTAVAAGTATEQDRFLLLLHFCLNQKWPAAFEELRVWESLVNKPNTPAKPGAAWVRIAVELVASRTEDARQNLVKQVEGIVAGTLLQAELKSSWQGGDLSLLTHTLTKLYGIQGWNEYGKIIAQVRPVFARQRDSQVALHDWKTRVLQVHDSLGEIAAAAKLHREMLADVPGDVYIRTRYAGRLNNSNRPDDALAFLKTELAKGDHWDQSEQNTLRFSFADILEGRGRYEEVLVFYEAWLPLEKTQSNLFPRYLTALVMNDKTDAVENTVKAWLKLIEQPGSLNNADQGRVNAAVRFCLGQAHNLSRYYGIDRRWLPELYKSAAHCLTRDDRLNELRSIAQNSHFYRSDEGDRLRGKILALLLKTVKQPARKLAADKAANQPAKLELPMKHARLSQLLSLLRAGRLLTGDGEEMQIRQVTQAEWTTIADALRKWWNDTPLAVQKRDLSSLLTTLYAQKLPNRLLPFLRARVQNAAAEYVAQYRQELYDRLLEQPWTPKVEAELFALWPQLTPTETVIDGKTVAVPDSVRTVHLVPLLYQLVDRMLQNRIAAAQQASQDKGNVDATTRTQRQATAEEIVKKAREGLADRLQQEWKQRGFDESPLPHWIMAEKMYLDLLLDRNQEGVLKWAWNELGAAPPKFVPPVEDAGDGVKVEDKPELTPYQLADRLVTKQLDKFLKQRAWVTVMNLSARKTADDKQAQKVLDYINAGIESAQAATDFINKKLKADGAREEELLDLTFGWRRTKYNALLLFDKPDELVTALKQWIARDAWDVPWRKALAKLYAERGQLEAAIAEMESVQKDGELTPHDHSVLADWYLVVDNRKAYERSRIETFKAMQEWQLNQLVQQHHNRIAQGDGPHELDETTLFMLQALFEKTASPSSYYWQVHNLYTSTRDFRLLAMIPESLLGRTQEAVYQALTNLQSYLIVEVRNEATADEILKHIHQLRKQINEGWVPRGADKNARALALDLRALDLIESMIERKASEVLNQPGAHSKAALVTFKRAFTQEWQTGERLLYARLLQNIGAVTHERNNPNLTPLADEQLRQMQQLYDDSEPAGDARVRIGLAHAQLLFNGYSRYDTGLRVLESALKEFAAAHDGLIPYTHNDLVMAYSEMLQQRKQFVKAEDYVQKHLDALENDGQRWTCVSHLNNLHAAALYDGSRTSLGVGTTLMDNLIARLVQQCDTSDDNHRYQLLNLISNMFSNVIERPQLNIPSAKPELLKFANTVLPELLAPQQNNYGSLVQNYASMIHSRINDLEALNFLLDRVAAYPPRFRYGYQDPWQQHGHSLAEFRQRAETLTKPGGKLVTLRERFTGLEKRLLPLVRTELRNDLTNLRGRQQAFYHNDYTYFWNAKAGEFLKVAEEVLEERKDAPRTIVYVAEYLYRGLDQHARAIEVLFVAHRRGLLDDDGQLQLVRYLHERSRWPESIALLEPIIDRRPDEMNLRVLLLRAYFHSQRTEQLAGLTKATDEHFHKDGRWVENNVIQFARVLAETRQEQHAADVFEEAIILHQNTQPNRGIGTGTLSAYYREVSAVYSRLGNDEKAVDSAAGAVVAWGNNQTNRKRALDSLQSAIAGVKELTAYIKTLDAKAKKTGEDSPLLRKIAGRVLQNRKEFREAITQYRVSLELQPYDRDVHQWLLECFDKLDDNAGAVQQLLAQIDFDRHNLALYKSLAKRTQDDKELAERAATSMIEQAPNEAESHQELAELLQEQNRWDKVIPLWKRVAELRKLEPTGLLGLAKAQLHQKQMTSAKKTLNQLRRKTWPAHFGDVDQQVRELERQLKP